MMEIDPAIGAILVIASATLFASAAVHKLKDFDRFQATFTAYRVLPRWLEPPITRMLPVLELTAALGLFSPATRSAAAALAAMLLVSYALAIGLNLHRGRRHIDCGCGGPHERRLIHSGLLWRNGWLVAVVLYASTPWTSRHWETTDAITVLLGSLATMLLYRCVDLLLASPNRRPNYLGGMR